MSFYGIKDNKCFIDLTERTPEISTIEELGYTSNTPLLDILDNYRNKNCLLIYSVSNTNIYPVTVPEDDSAIVIINKVGNHANIEFHFYDSFYTNQYSFSSQTGHHLAGWVQVGKTVIARSFVSVSTINAGQTVTVHEDLSRYNIPSDAAVIITPISTTFDKDRVIYLDFKPLLVGNDLYVCITNTSSNATFSIKFNWCIL